MAEGKLQLIQKYGEKSAYNMEHYTRKWIDGKIQFMLGQLKSWCGGEVWTKFEALKL